MTTQVVDAIHMPGADYCNQSIRKHGPCRMHRKETINVRRNGVVGATRNKYMACYASDCSTLVRGNK
eukprot:4780149-Prorocentrum_lima.AAC.1